MRRGAAAAILSALMAGLPQLASRARTEPVPDPLAAEIDRWAAFLRTNAATDDTWVQLKAGAEPLMARAREALGDGRRLLALQRLLAVRADLSARMGDVLRAHLAPVPAGALEGRSSRKPASSTAPGSSTGPCCATCRRPSDSRPFDRPVRRKGRF